MIQLLLNNSHDSMLFHYIIQWCHFLFSYEVCAKYRGLITWWDTCSTILILTNLIFILIIHDTLLLHTPFKKAYLKYLCYLSVVISYWHHSSVKGNLKKILLFQFTAFKVSHHKMDKTTWSSFCREYNQSSSHSGAVSEMKCNPEPRHVWSTQSG